MSSDFSHAFVVPAYKFSEHLKDCLDSLLKQTVQSQIMVVTSTPDEKARQLCESLNISYQVHSPNRGIGPDWNAAVRAADAQWVTVAHQDDVYYPGFAQSVRDVAMSKIGDEVVMMFSDYDEITDSGKRPKSRLLWIKTALLHFGFAGRRAIRDRFSKLNVLRFACPIPCPAVTMNVKLHPEGYDESYQVNLDWATWLSAASKDGYFVWIPRVLMGHRIHESSETSAAISDGRRQSEDFRVLSQLWPHWIARRIAGSYGVAYSSNEIE